MKYVGVDGWLAVENDDEFVAAEQYANIEGPSETFKALTELSETVLCEN